MMWVVFTALGCGMTIFYAAKVKKNPRISVAYESDQYFRDQNEKTGIDEGHAFGIGHVLVLLTLAATVIWVVWGVMKDSQSALMVERVQAVRLIRSKVHVSKGWAVTGS